MPLLKLPLDFVENVVDQTCAAGFRPGEPKFDSYGSIFGVWLCPVRIKSMG